MFMLAAFAGGMALSAAGSIMQVGAAKEAAAIQKGIIGEQKNQEAIRYKAMDLDARRKQREIVRQGIIARSQALATGTSQGAGQSSGLQGAFGQIAGQSNWALQGVDQNLAFGRDMFKSNENLFGLRQQEADVQASAAVGGAISGIGKSLISNIGPIGRITGGNG